MSVSTRVEMPIVPAWLSALPMLAAAGRRQDDDAQINLALASAAAALEADSDRSDSRTRLCFFLSELASQYGRGAGDYARPIPVSRARLARATGISLPRVKRILGYLELSQIVSIAPSSITVRDWTSLCELGRFDRNWSAMPVAEEDNLIVIASTDESPPTRTLTGDPACFA